MANYTVRIGKRKFDVEFRNDGTILLNGEEKDWTFQMIGPHQAVVSSPVRTRAFVLAGREENRVLLHSSGREANCEVMDQRLELLQRVRGASAALQSVSEIRAPMPGLIVKVKVNEGESVRPGTNLLVLEAMKMENEIRSVQYGVVEKIHVKQGMAVEKNQPLVKLFKVV
ncbi:MAG: hypothetical protein COS95_04020 [Ignavibacteriales bacterium CG07_land_8_20_14_0_80_59_12]|nr:MAG: hypothetical protein COS95_04020 [Ignavibacteriales bacterium CG07_land_8_20_14_0_80_59_12]